MRLLTAAFLLLAAVSSHANEDIRRYFETLNSGYNLPVHGDHLVSIDELKTFYEEHNYQAVWYQGGKTIWAATELYLAIETAGIDGLRPEDYHNRALQESCPAEETEAIGYCDLLFTDAFLILARHLSEGKINPSVPLRTWTAVQRSKNLISLLNDALAENTLKNVMTNLRPRQLGYERLMAALKRLRAATRYPTWAPLALSPAIEPGQEDERLAAIIERLVFWGDMQAPAVPIALYDAALQQAVERFQERHGLAADGVIGPSTLEALNVDPTRRAQQIMANMERRRWLSSELGSKYVRVNIAQRELVAVEHDKVIFTQPVTVGSHYRDTPSFSDKIRYLTVNPDWTVPLEFARTDFLPMWKDNPQSMELLQFTLFSGSEEVAPASIDWSGVSSQDFDYRLVQKSGPRNAMGRVKFIFPNVHKVYLHDAPEEDLFGNGEGFSAGSMRVAKPFALAVWLLSDNAWPIERLQQLVVQGAQKTVFLRSAVPIHVEYRTAWVTTGGVLNFRQDFQQRDTALYEKLTKPLTNDR